jgi:Fe-S-cluster containining protein
LIDIACFIDISRILSQNMDMKIQSAGKSSFNFECRQCGICCGSGLEIYVNSLDIWKIRNHFHEPTGVIIQKYLTLEMRAEYGSYPLCLIRHKDGRCPFNDGRLCTIHQARPASCRLFPVTHVYGSKGESRFAAEISFDFCNGVNDAPEIAFDNWLLENAIGDYEKVIDIQKCLSSLMKVRLDENKRNSVFNILFDYDSEAGFPFRDIYPEDKESEIGMLDWIEQETNAFMFGIRK